MIERRKSTRSRTFFAGTIAFNKRKSTMDCHVRNVSAGGAKVAFTNTAVIPDQFDLTIARKDRSFSARMVWRGVNEAGVVFVNEYEDSSQSRWNGRSACANARLKKPRCGNVSLS